MDYCVLNHHETFAKKQFNNYHKRGLIYAIPYGFNRTEKYLKDTVYFKIWGKPRNDMLNILSSDDYWKYMNDGSIYFKEKQISFNEHFSILSIEVPDKIERLYNYHLQTHNMDNFYMDMDDKFEHAHKPLFMYNSNLKYKMKVIGTIETQLKRNKKIEVNLRGF